MALDNGFGQYFSNEFNLLYHQDELKAKKLLGSSLRVTFFSGLIQTFIVLGFLLIDLNENSSMYFIQKAIAPYVLILILYRMCLGGFKGILVKTPIALGFYHKSAFIGLIEFTLELLVIVLASWKNLTLLETSLVFVSTKACYVFISLWLIKSWTKSLFPWWKWGSLKEGYLHYIKSIPLILKFISDKFSVDGINILISATLGPNILPLFTTTKTLSSTITKLSSLIFDPLVPEVGRLHAKKGFSKIRDFIQLGWITNGLIALVILIFSVFAKELYNYWLKGEYSLNENLYISMMAATILFNFGRPILSYLTSINHIKGLLTITILKAIITFILAHLLISEIGLLGVGISLFTAELLTGVLGPYLFYNSTSQKQYQINMGEIAWAVVQLLFISIGLYLVVHGIMNSTVLIIIISGVTLSISYIIFNNLTLDTKKKLKSQRLNK